MTFTNRDRAEWAAAALRHFQSLTGTDHTDSLGDLLCDLHHWCNRENVNFQSALECARQHYDAESSEGLTTSYMATFNTPAGIATEIFEANSPEEALQQARKFADDPQLTEVDIEPTADGYSVREIIITDEHGRHHALWQTDEYRLQLAAPQLLKVLESQVGATRQIVDAWDEMNSLSEAVEDLIEALDRQSESTRAELNAWGTIDLAGAVGDLEESLRDVLKTIADAKGGAA